VLIGPGTYNASISTGTPTATGVTVAGYGVFAVRRSEHKMKKMILKGCTWREQLTGGVANINGEACYAI